MAKSAGVTDSFDSRNGDYRTGVLEYELPELQPGEHRIGLKAWDNFNNSTTVEAELQVSEPGTASSPISCSTRTRCGTGVTLPTPSPRRPRWSESACFAGGKAGGRFGRRWRAGIQPGGLDPGGNPRQRKLPLSHTGEAAKRSGVRGQLDHPSDQVVFTWARR